MKILMVRKAEISLEARWKMLQVPFDKNVDSFVVLTAPFALSNGFRLAFTGRLSIRFRWRLFDDADIMTKMTNKENDGDSIIPKMAKHSCFQYRHIYWVWQKNTASDSKCWKYQGLLPSLNTHLRVQKFPVHPSAPLLSTLDDSVLCNELSDDLRSIKDLDARKSKANDLRPVYKEEAIRYRALIDKQA